MYFLPRISPYIFGGKSSQLNSNIKVDSLKKGTHKPWNVDSTCTNLWIVLCMNSLTNWLQTTSFLLKSSLKAGKWWPAMDISRWALIHNTLVYDRNLVSVSSTETKIKFLYRSLNFFCLNRNFLHCLFSNCSHAFCALFWIFARS